MPYRPCYSTITSKGEGVFTVHQCGRRDRLDVVSAAMDSSPNGSASQLLWTAVEGTPRTKRPNEHHHLLKPMAFTCFLNKSKAKGFVKGSATISPVRRQRSMTSSFLFLTKWYLISMCFVRPWNLESLE